MTGAVTKRRQEVLASPPLPRHPAQWTLPGAPDPRQALEVPGLQDHAGPAPEGAAGLSGAGGWGPAALPLGGLSPLHCFFAASPVTVAVAHSAFPICSSGGCFIAPSSLSPFPSPQGCVGTSDFCMPGHLSKLFWDPIPAEEGRSRLSRVPQITSPGGLEIRVLGRDVWFLCLPAVRSCT